MSKTMSLRLSEAQLADIERVKRRYHQPSISSTLQLLLTEKLREVKHPHITFRDTAVGRQAYVEGTGLAVWEVMMVARAHDDDARRTAEHLGISERMVQAAFTYARDFEVEIAAAVAEVDATDFDSLKQILPNIERFVAPRDEEPAASSR